VKNKNSRRPSQAQIARSFAIHFAAEALPDLREFAATLGDQVRQGRPFDSAHAELMAEAMRRGWCHLEDKGRAWVEHKLLDWLRDASEGATP
jgi:hypothetical protein